MSNSSMPDSQDLGLSGGIPSSLNDAVQHDRQDLVQPFQALTLEQKLSALTEASSGGEQWLALLNQGLEDADLRVRTEAYRQLKINGYPSPVLERGIPLRVGDRIYAVYKSSIEYGDDWYDIISKLNQNSDHLQYFFYFKARSSTGKRFEFITDKLNGEGLHASGNLIAYFVDSEIAEKNKELAYLEKFGELECDINQIYPKFLEYGDSFLKNFDLPAWAEARGITVNPEIGDDYEEHEIVYAYKVGLFEKLYQDIKFELLRELWPQFGYDPLAFIHEYVIDRPCYLKLHQIEIL
jgi:hypothetical protein